MTGIVGHSGVLMGGGSQLWTPAQLGPYDWHSPFTSATDAGGGACSQWNTSRSSRHLVQGTGTARPTIISSAINSLRGIRFDGTSDFMTVTSGTALFQNVTSAWAFIVFKKLALDVGAGTRQVLFSSVNTGASNTRLGVDISAATANRIRLIARRLDGDSAGTLSADTLADTNYHMLLVVMDWSTGNGAVYLDGNAATTGSLTSTGSTSNTASAAAPSVGALWNGSAGSGFADIETTEVILNRNQVLVTDDVDRLFGWAAHEHALTGNLPGGHPYISSPP